MSTYSSAERRIEDAERPEKATAENVRRLRTGFFVVSKVVESPEMLQGWVEWFRKLNIPCAIEKRRGGGYTLWRKGEEVGGKGPVALAELKKKRIIGAFGM
jgi:hypothetical protein